MLQQEIIRYQSKTLQSSVVQYSDDFLYSSTQLISYDGLSDLVTPLSPHVLLLYFKGKCNQHIHVIKFYMVQQHWVWTLEACANNRFMNFNQSYRWTIYQNSSSNPAMLNKHSFSRWQQWCLVWCGLLTGGDCKYWELAGGMGKFKPWSLLNCKHCLMFNLQYWIPRFTI